MLSILTIKYQRDFLFWSNQFGDLYASCIFIGIAFFRLGNFSSMVLLKAISGPLAEILFLSFIPIILRFGFVIMAQISWMFLSEVFRFNIFSDQCIYFFHSIFTSEFLCSISCILLMKLASVVPLQISIFFIMIPSGFVFFIDSIFFLGLEQFYVFPPIVYIFLSFFKVFIHFIFKTFIIFIS